MGKVISLIVILVIIATGFVAGIYFCTLEADSKNQSIVNTLSSMQAIEAQTSNLTRDSGAGVDPVEVGAGGGIYVPSGSDDITVGGGNDNHEITLPSTNGTSGYEITEPSYPGNNDPVYTTAGTTVTTTGTSVTTVATTRTTIATTTSKSTTTRASSVDNWATLPEEIQEVIISETFEGSLSDFFH